MAPSRKEAPSVSGKPERRAAKTQRGTRTAPPARRSKRTAKTQRHKRPPPAKRTTRTGKSQRVKRHPPDRPMRPRRLSMRTGSGSEEDTHPARTFQVKGTITLQEVTGLLQPIRVEMEEVIGGMGRKTPAASRSNRETESENEETTVDDWALDTETETQETVSIDGKGGARTGSKKLPTDSPSNTSTNPAVKTTIAK